jgi:hypothetical protein
MISSVRNFVVRILDADRFTIALFQILDIKSNYLPGIVHKQSTLRNKLIIVQFLNWQSTLLTSKVDGYMPMRGSVNMRRDLFMGKLNPKKNSQRLQDLNKYLDYIPIERTTLTDRTKKAYGKSLPEDEIRSIMGRAIPPEWTVNLLALVKEPWRFKDL